jgi:hypothetical protein
MAMARFCACVIPQYTITPLLGSNGTRHMSTSLTVIEAAENLPAALGPDLAAA